MGRSNNFVPDWLLWGSLATLSYALSAQSQATDASGKVVFKAETRTVVVDVVVTGKNGQPVKGLPRDDFEILEDGRPQRITTFEEHTTNDQSKATLPQLPSNIFTNVPRMTPTDSMTVLLLDSLNTPLEDQARVHMDTLKYLENLQPGRRLAIFTLGSRLRYVQGFTDDRSTLRQALLSVRRGAGPQASLLLPSKTENTAEEQAIAHLGDLSPAAASAAAGLRDFLQHEAASRNDARLQTTLEAFQELAHYLSGIPGRKNVVWFSGGFPMVLFPNSGLGNPTAAQRDFGDRVRKTDAALVAAQVAIYPIAAEGLVGNSLNDADTQLVGVHSGYDAQRELNKSLQDDAAQRNANHATMDEIARDTGGEAIYNTNALNDSLARVIDHGSSYYTLYYTPTDLAANGQFRKIKIKLSGGNYKLAYRQGYYATDAKQVPPRVVGTGTDPLQSQMAPGIPESTQIPFALRVQPAKADATNGLAKQTDAGARAGDNLKLTGAATRYSVDFVIAARGLQLDPAPDGGRNGKIEATLVLYDQDGKPLNWLVRQLDLTMDATRYAQVEENGVNFRLQVDAPKGAESLRGGVYDWLSNLSGTLEIPLDGLAHED